MIVLPVTGRSDPVQFVGQTLQSGNPVADMMALLLRDVVGTIQRRPLRAFKRDQFGHISQRQAKIPRMANELQPLQRGWVIAALVSGAAVGARHQSFFLVESDGRSLDPGAP